MKKKQNQTKRPSNKGQSKQLCLTSELDFTAQAWLCWVQTLQRGQSRLKEPVTVEARRQHRLGGLPMQEQPGGGDGCIVRPGGSWGLLAFCRWNSQRPGSLRRPWTSWSTRLPEAQTQPSWRPQGVQLEVVEPAEGRMRRTESTVSAGSTSGATSRTMSVLTANRLSSRTEFYPEFSSSHWDPSPSLFSSSPSQIFAPALLAKSWVSLPSLHHMVQFTLALFHPFPPHC